MDANQDKVDLNLVRIFLEVFRHSSLTLAADSLNMSQPSVSAAIKRFSDQIGGTLFVRKGRGIVPTNIAIQIANECEQPLSHIQCSIQNLSQFSTNNPRTFKVFATEPIMLLLQPLIEKSQLLGQCEIKLQLTPPSEAELLEELNNQTVDLALDVVKLDYAFIQNDIFFTDQLMLACAKDHPRVQGNISLKQFYEEKHVRNNVRRNRQDAVSHFSKVPLEKRKIEVEVGSILVGHAIAGKTEILCISTSSLCDVYADSLGLQKLALPFATNPLKQYMLWHKRTQNSTAHQWLRATLQEITKNMESAS